MDQKPKYNCPDTMNLLEKKWRKFLDTISYISEKNKPLETNKTLRNQQMGIKQQSTDSRDSSQNGNKLLD